MKKFLNVLVAVMLCFTVFCFMGCPDPSNTGDNPVDNGNTQVDNGNTQGEGENTQGESENTTEPEPFSVAGNTYVVTSTYMNNAAYNAGIMEYYDIYIYEKLSENIVTFYIESPLGTGWKGLVTYTKDGENYSASISEFKVNSNPDCFGNLELVEWIDNDEEKAQMEDAENSYASRGFANAKNSVETAQSTSSPLVFTDETNCTCKIQGEEKSGTYTIDEANSTITLTIEGTNYSITYSDDGEKLNLATAYVDDQRNESGNGDVTIYGYGFTKQ